MLISDSFAAAKKDGIFFFISAPAIIGAPYLAVISAPEMLDDVSALSLEELILAIRDKLLLSTEVVADIFGSLLSWQPKVSQRWHEVESTGYYICVTPFVKSGLTQEDSEFCFFLWHSLDNGSMHIPASSLFAIPDIDQVTLIQAASRAALDYQQLSAEIDNWLRSC